MAAIQELLAEELPTIDYLVSHSTNVYEIKYLNNTHGYNGDYQAIELCVEPGNWNNFYTEKLKFFIQKTNDDLKIIPFNTNPDLIAMDDPQNTDVRFWLPLVKFIKPIDERSYEIFPQYTPHFLFKLILKHLNMTEKSLRKTPMRKHEILSVFMNGRCLSDGVINRYYQLINMKFNNVYAFNTIFYDCVRNGRTRALEKIRERNQIFAKDKLIIPIHIAEIHHWALICVLMKERQIIYYDSIRQSEIRYKRLICGQMKEYLQWGHYKQHKTNAVYHIQDGNPSILQNNAFDCGVYICLNAKNFASGKAPNYNQNHIKLYRHKMVAELFDINLF